MRISSFISPRLIFSVFQRAADPLFLSVRGQNVSTVNNTDHQEKPADCDPLSNTHTHTSQSLTFV